MPELHTKDINPAELPKQITDFVKGIASQYPNSKAMLIPTLIEAQKYYGHVTDEVAMAIGKLLKVPYGEVEAVIDFYTMILQKPTGEYIVGLCDTWNCEWGGAAALKEHFIAKYGKGVGEITADGKFTLLMVECLCDCHNPPSLQFLQRGEHFTPTWSNNLTVELFDAILDDLAAGKADALRERFVRMEKKQNAPDDRNWVWLVTTRNQYPCVLEGSGDAMKVIDGFGKFGDLKNDNPALHAEIAAAAKEL
ncbi:MAG: NAD(P)H-dependent oxidoreductase subunit E [Planctomycetales bacterium]|nr:NAD(P)H-dependent oxidoreductase subunit E [bacterium]UNM08062.1 MAG: NAD(P)H-dependent oxidoreductase subunit E [Planctomycetales bacterium]